MRNGHTSFWLYQQAGTASPRPALPGDRQTDVAIIGAGFTGLWTAYWLTQVDPSLKVTIIESRHVGYGASGRNGGWLSGKMVGLRQRLATSPKGRQGVLDLQRACFTAIDDVLGLMTSHGHDIEAARTGFLQVARTPAELARLHTALATDRAWGLSPDDINLIDAAQLNERVHVSGALGALYSPHNATLNPARLVNALAEIVERAGVTIYEGTAAERIEPGCVQTQRGRLHAPIVLRATEGYTARLPDGQRELLPMNSSMIVTQPLSAADWNSIGWNGREGLSGASHRYFYAQRTADGRIALGGRGLPYRFGSRVDRDGWLDSWTVKQLRGILHNIFPALSGVEVAHAWCGVLGVPRDWSPSVRYDRSSGLGAAGGYVGQGVTASYVAGRTLADLVTNRDSLYTQLPWTNRPWPKWESEPWRFAGAYTMYGLYQIADTIENRRRAPTTAAVARIADKVSGRA